MRLRHTSSSVVVREAASVTAPKADLMEMSHLQSVWIRCQGWLICLKAGQMVFISTSLRQQGAQQPSRKHQFVNRESVGRPLLVIHITQPPRQVLASVYQMGVCPLAALSVNQSLQVKGTEVSICKNGFLSSLHVGEFEQEEELVPNFEVDSFVPVDSSEYVGVGVIKFDYFMGETGFWCSFNYIQHPDGSYEDIEFYERNAASVREDPSFINGCHFIGRREIHLDSVDSNHQHAIKQRKCLYLYGRQCNSTAGLLNLESVFDGLRAYHKAVSWLILENLQLQKPSV